MKTLTLLAILSLLAACPAQGPKGDTGPRGQTGPQGPPGMGTQGPVGPKGGGLYTSRQDVYCKQAMGARSDAGYGLRVACDDPNDLGLIGSCEGVSTPNSFLVSNAPGGWGDTAGSSFPPDWSCRWTFDPGPGPAELPLATANICCIKHQ